ncbi:MAG: hypothetical protein IIU25_01185 [Oscillospiraceae bacterium]|nr:hypothetical protein [Oscillospiraceae bacterium]
MAADRCESCVYYVYDDEDGSYSCEVGLDEDEMYRFLGGNCDDCPYYRLDDEYSIAGKQ